MYPFEYSDTSKIKANGFEKCDLNNLIFNKTFNRIQEAMIVSKKHDISTILQNKVGLSSFYDKKYVLDDGIYSRSYGQFKDN